MTEQNNPSTSLKQLSVEIAQDFLQSAVILDDQAVFREDTAPTRLIAPDYVPTGDGERESDPQPPSHYLDAKLLVDSFADHGLVCSVFKPREGGGYAQRIKNIAAKADIVILDWTLFQENEGDFADVGNETLRLIGEILENDESGNRDQNRLIAVYTAEPDLKSVTDKIESWLTAKGLAIERSDNSINSGRLRISVISKNQVDEGQLPLQLITDFASMIQGLLPNVAFSGLAALRQNTYQLLGRFNADMDAAYLGQRILSENPPDAERQLVIALTGEIQAILEDNQVGERAGSAAMRAWVEDAVKDGLDLVDALDPQSAHDRANSTDFACELLEKGAGATGGRHGGLTSRPWRNATRTFLINKDSALQADHEYAALLSLKRSYGTPAPRLWLGSVVAIDVEDTTTYWLCVQPRCDSTNLGGDTNFPFLPLLGNDNATRLLEACVVRDGDELKTFKVSERIREMLMVKFTPGANPPGEVIAEREGGQYFFKTLDKPFRWVGELKSEPAQRIANRFAAWTARVGLEESAWLAQYQP